MTPANRDNAAAPRWLRLNVAFASAHFSTSWGLLIEAIDAENPSILAQRGISSTFGIAADVRYPNSYRLPHDLFRLDRDGQVVPQQRIFTDESQLFASDPATETQPARIEMQA